MATTQAQTQHDANFYKDDTNLANFVSSPDDVGLLAMLAGAEAKKCNSPCRRSQEAQTPAEKSRQIRGLILTCGVSRG